MKKTNLKWLVLSVYAAQGRAAKRLRVFLKIHKTFKHFKHYICTFIKPIQTTHTHTHTLYQAERQAFSGI